MVMHRDLDSETGQVVTPSREIRVREMTEAETEAYWARFVDDYTHILIGELRAPGYARREAQWLADQSREGGESVSAIVDASTGKTAGALWFAVTPTGTGAIVDIRMLEEHRGQGYGSATLQHLVQKGGSMGARSLSLGVAFDNPVALRLYRKFSFSPTTIELRRRLEVG